MYESYIEPKRGKIYGYLNLADRNKTTTTTGSDLRGGKSLTDKNEIIDLQDAVHFWTRPLPMKLLLNMAMFLRVRRHVSCLSSRHLS